MGMNRATKLFREGAQTLGNKLHLPGVIHKVEAGVKKVVKTAMTPRDSSGYDRVGNQLIKRK